MAENRNTRAAALYVQTDPRRILYQSGCMRFANLDAPHYAVVWDLLVEYCIEWRCDHRAPPDAREHHVPPAAARSH